MKEVVTTKVTKTHRLEMSGRNIISMLRSDGLDVPPNATVTFEVPTGGDYSGMTVDVNGDHPVTISWTTHEESTNG